MAKMTAKDKEAAKRKRARNKFRGVNVTDAAIGYGGLSIWTDALLKVDPIQFFTDTTGGGSAYKVTGREIIDSIMGGKGGAGSFGNNAFNMIEHNARQNGLMAVGKSVVYGVVTGVGKTATRKPRNFLNAQLKNLKLDKWIKF
jgi:hypothetical protein